MCGVFGIYVDDEKMAGSDSVSCKSINTKINNKSNRTSDNTA